MALVATRTVDSEFADVICADPEWLRAEFDALMASAFGEPPAPPPPAPPRLPPDRDAWYPAAEAGGSCSAQPSRRRFAATWCGRQRAPPA
jgi:hypothetical protein